MNNVKMVMMVVLIVNVNQDGFKMKLDVILHVEMEYKSKENNVMMQIIYNMMDVMNVSMIVM